MSERMTLRPARLCAALGALALASCTPPARNAMLPPGTWTGDMHAPELPSAIGLMAEVGANGSLELIVLGAMGFDGGSMAEVTAGDGELRFRWPSENHRSCTLRAGNGGILSGACVTPGDSPWQLRLLPPAQRRAPAGHAHSILSRADRRWRTLEQPWGRLSLPAETDSVHGDAARASALIDSAIRHALGMLGESSYDRALDAFLVAGRPDLKQLTGRAVGSTSDPHGSTVILAGYGRMPTVVRHEIMHVLSINLWGVPPEPAAWIREGIATYAGGHCAGYDLPQLSAAMKRDGRLLPLHALLDEFYQHSDLVTYLQSGSVVQYLNEQFGRDVLERTWRAGLRYTLQQRGTTLEELERDWLQWISRPDRHPEQVDWTRLAGGCQ